MQLLDRSFAAVLLDWGPAGPADPAELRSRLEALSAAGVHAVVTSRADDVDRQLAARPGGPGRLHLCENGGALVYEVTAAGPALVKGSAPTPAQWAVGWLARYGITGGLVLVGADPEAAAAMVAAAPDLARATFVDPDQLLGALDEQLARQREGRVPWIDEDATWIVPLPDGELEQRVAESIGTLGNGFAGIRGAREEDGGGATPLFLVNGVYTGDAVPQLVPGPIWTNLSVPGGGYGGRAVDLRTGVLVRHDPASGLRSMRFVSAARPHALVMRAEAPVEQLDADDPFTPIEGVPLERADGAIPMARTASPGGGGVTVAVRDRVTVAGARRDVERLAAWAADTDGPPSWEAAAGLLADVEQTGFERLLAEHREAWARQWADAQVDIDGDDADQLAARFAVFHLLTTAPDEGEAAVGPRGLTGTGYGGHVFWDADVFVLPALAAIRPGAARAMIEYRIRRLPAARTTAARLGLAGARFPWESATSGVDVTPRRVDGKHGELIPIRTGDQEEHIIADVAWATHEYARWTGDDDLLTGAGRELIVETARYWASRIRTGREGRGHLYGLMGPDEYHEVVDDNAFTNVMARWNLRRGAALLEATGGDPAEAAAWRDLADWLIDGWDPDRELYEQFAGYWRLEPILAEQIARRPFAGDMLLGAKRVSGSQILKQADVLMLHHLVPTEVRPGSLAANLDFYEPRTTHGSSLSPAIHAALFARAGQPEQALENYRIAARLDLDDLTSTTAGGLHLATMGGLWQALAYGFMGLRPHAGRLDIAPCLPKAWNALGVRFRFQGQQLAVRAEGDRLTITCERPFTVRVNGGDQVCAPPVAEFTIDQGRNS